MNNASTCPVCGARLPTGTLGGPCPACALAELLEDDGTDGTGFSPGPIPETGPAPGPGLRCTGVPIRGDGGPELAPGAAPQPPAEVSPGAATVGAARRWGDYELIEEIARGGMGVVYKARQRSLDRIVALKTILPQAGPDAARRFHAEATAVAALQHPNIVEIHEVGEVEGQPYFSMDYVAGRSLAELVRNGALPARRVATYVRTIANAVHYAHRHGILHRDLKPSNILIDETDQPRITDFGLAKRLAGGSDLTLTGQVLGSPNYMAPEQIGHTGGSCPAPADRDVESTPSAPGLARSTSAHGSSPSTAPFGLRRSTSRFGFRRSTSPFGFRPSALPLGPPTDVYGLGAILYHLLTGRPPFQAETLTALLRQVVDTDPVAPRLLNPSIPRDLETVCLKCLEKEIGRRYPTAQMVADDLGRFLGDEPIRARRIGWAGRLWRWCRRKPVIATLGAGLLAALAVGVVGVGWQAERAKQNARLAVHNAYAADMNLAAKAVAEDDLGRALELLEKYRPAPGSVGGRNAASIEDLRDWEWRYLWQQCQGDDLLSYTVESNIAQNVALSADGRYLAVWAPARSVRVFDLTTGVPLRLPTESPEPGAMAFSPRENLLAQVSVSAEGGQAVMLWQIPSAESRRLPTIDSVWVPGLAFSPDGARLAASSAAQGVSLWEATSGRLVRQIPAPYSAYRSGLAFSPEGRALAIGEGELGLFHGPIWPVVRVVELASGKEAVLPAPRAWRRVSALAWSPDGRWLAAGYGGPAGTVRLWQAHRLVFDQPPPALVIGDEGLPLTADASTARSEAGEGSTNVPPFQTLSGHRDRITGLVFTPDGRHLVSASADQTLRLWNLDKLEAARVLRGHRNEITSLALFPDGQRLITGSRDGTVRCWNLFGPERLPPRFELPPVGTAHNAGAFTPDGRSLLTVNVDGSLALWDTYPPRLVAQRAEWGADNASVAVSPDGRWLGLGKTNGLLEVWHRETPHRLTNVSVGTGSVMVLRFNTRGTRLLAAAYRVDPGWTFVQYEVPSWRPLGPWVEPSNQVFPVSFGMSPDDRLVFVGDNAGSFCWFDARTLRQIACVQVPEAEGVTGFGFSPDGRRVATACWSGGVLEWDIRTRRLLTTLRAHRSCSTKAEWLPGGRRLLTAGGGSDALKLWDVIAWRDVLTLEGEGIGFGGMASPDGDTLLAGTKELIHLWHAPSFEEIEAIERARQHGRLVLEEPSRGRP